MRRIISKGAVALVSMFAFSAQAGVILYTDQAAWEAAVNGHEALITNRANVGLANEAPASPTDNAQFGTALTWNSSNTGLSNSFRLRNIGGGNLVFNDHEGSGSIPDFQNALSIGDIDNYENDDWRLDILSGPLVFGFGFDLRNNHGSSTEMLFANGESVSLAGVGFNSFVGIVTDFAFTVVEFDEDAGGDDIAIANLRFAHSVPEPAMMSLLMISLLGLAFRRRRV